jgi:hypothetical protein
MSRCTWLGSNTLNYLLVKELKGEWVKKTINESLWINPWWKRIKCLIQNGLLKQKKKIVNPANISLLLNWGS